MTRLPTVGLIAALTLAAHAASPQTPRALVASEFIAPALPTPSAHASTIVETAAGLVAAWFGGTRESAADVEIWLSRFVGGRWTTPVAVANGVQDDGRRFPCWNPVLWRAPDGTLLLFYKVGPAPARWWGVRTESRDDGRTWSPPIRLPDSILGPIKNKPVQLADGTLLSPSSTESTDATPIWRVHFERSTDRGRTWTIVDPPDSGTIQAIPPTLLTHAGGRVQAIGRTRSSRLFETWSSDAGRTWTPLALLDVPNPNAGIDAVTLADGRQILVYNNTTTGRTPLSVATSRDGKTWTPSLTLEDQPGVFVSGRDSDARRARARHVHVAAPKYSTRGD